MDTLGLAGQMNEIVRQLSLKSGIWNFYTWIKINEISQLQLIVASKFRRVWYLSFLYHNGAKILNLSKNSHFENLIFHKIHNFKV